MATVKTAISIEKTLFDLVDMMAKKMNISRSRLFVIAVQEYMERHENKALLNAINAAYEDVPEIESKMVAQMRPRHYKAIKDQW